MARRLTATALVVGAALAGGAYAPADDPPAPDGLARLRAFGRPVAGAGGSRLRANGTVTAVDDRSITIRGWFGAGVENAKEEDDSGSYRYGRRVRNDPKKPIVLSFPDWEVDCLSLLYTPDGMTVLLLNGQEVVVRDADRPARRFPAAPELRSGNPHPAISLPGRIQCHLLTDVRVRDEVSLQLNGPPGKEECIWVAISRRPGGRVPHSTLNAEFFRDWIDRDNAYQDFERDRIPIPDRFRRDLQRMRDEAFLRGEAPAAPAPPPPPKRP